MNIVKVERLSIQEFSTYGFYSNLLNLNTERLGEKPVEFFRDMIQLSLGVPIISFSTCRVESREFIIDTSEYHSYTGECVLPLDNDILIHVGPATNGVVPVGKIRVFYIPRGTMVVLRPGIWHHAPFTTGDKPVNVLIALPERTYANDCRVVELNEHQKIRIDTVM